MTRLGSLSLVYTETTMKQRYRDTKSIHLPSSGVGFLIDILLVLFLLTVVAAANRNSHSVSDMLYSIFPYVVTTFLLREWIAAKLS
jgi:hypothetical protein